MLNAFKQRLKQPRLSKLSLMASLLCLSIPLHVLQADAFGWQDMKQATKNTMSATVNTVKKPFNKDADTVKVRLRQAPATYTPVSYTAPSQAQTLPPLNQHPSSQTTAPNSSSTASAPAYGASLEASIQLYREGKYVEAEKMLNTLHKRSPENTRITYYLAISEAQLGRVAMARKHYEEIILLTPNHDTARLSEIGLRHLPHSSQKLDPPPKLSKLFKHKKESKPDATADDTRQYTTVAPSTPFTSNLPKPLSGSVTAAEAARQIQSARTGASYMPSTQNNQSPNQGYNPTNTQATNPANAVSPMMSPEMQQLMMMQNMMGGMGSYPGSNAASGMNNNPMATMMMMQSMQQNAGQNQQNGRTTPAMDPSMMSDMMMNQMLQNFNFGGDTKDR